MKVYFRQREIQNGQIVSLNDAQKHPVIEFIGDCISYYTLIMWDPDAPSAENPIYSPWLHWIVQNVSKNEDIPKSIAEYVPPTPPVDTGYHRYIIDIYRQPEYVNYPTIPRDKRNNFDLDGFIKSNRLQKIDTFYFRSINNY